jgi:hypothetical protein
MKILHSNSNIQRSFSLIFFLYTFTKDPFTTEINLVTYIFFFSGVPYGTYILILPIPFVIFHTPVSLHSITILLFSGMIFLSHLCQSEACFYSYVSKVYLIYHAKAKYSVLHGGRNVQRRTKIMLQKNRRYINTRYCMTYLRRCLDLSAGCQ